MRYSGGASRRLPLHCRRLHSLRPYVIAVAIAIASGLTAAPAAAHGPNVRVSYRTATPAALTIEVGQTVHFQNANSAGGPCTVIEDEGAFESPTLGHAEGWHYTFVQPGTFAYHVREFPGVTGIVRVVEP